MKESKSGSASMREEREAFYIRGRQYVPAESWLLCIHRNGKQLVDLMGASEELYLTKKGRTYFKVTRGDTFSAGENQAEIIEEKTAREFMDKHTGGIIRENYIAAFGEPEID